MVFVVVLHLAPGRESLLPELLGRVTEMPVLAARDGAVVQPNTVYVIPPGRQLTAVDGNLRLTELEVAARHSNALAQHIKLAGFPTGKLGHLLEWTPGRRCRT